MYQRIRHHLDCTITAYAPALLALAMLSIGVSACSKNADTELRTDGGEATPVFTVGGDRAKTPAERGKYLVTVGGCHDCHTPWKVGPDGKPGPDMTRMLSGHPEDVKMTPPPNQSSDSPWLWNGAATNTAFSGPWGRSYTMNLTPDTLTGIGFWTEEMFMKTIRSGKHYGTSRPIMPPMPWFNYAEMTDEDLKAVYAYLRTIPPVVNHVPPYEPPSSTTVVADGGETETADH